MMSSLFFTASDVLMSGLEASRTSDQLTTVLLNWNENNSLSLTERISQFVRLFYNLRAVSFLKRKSKPINLICGVMDTAQISLRVIKRTSSKETRFSKENILDALELVAAAVDYTSNYALLNLISKKASLKSLLIARICTSASYVFRLLCATANYQQSPFEPLRIREKSIQEKITWDCMEELIRKQPSCANDEEMQIHLAKLSDRLKHPDDLLEMQEIPSELYQDPILSQYRCALNKNKLMRYPVLVEIRRPGTESKFVLCERAELLKFSATDQVLPNLHCTFQQLIFKPSFLEATIYQRLIEIYRKIAVIKNIDIMAEEKPTLIFSYLAKVNTYCHDFQRKISLISVLLLHLQGNYCLSAFGNFLRLTNNISLFCTKQFLTAGATGYGYFLRSFSEPPSQQLAYLKRLEKQLANMNCDG